MIKDSKSSKVVGPAPVATMFRIEAEDVSRFEGEGGPEAPEPRVQDQHQTDPSTWNEMVARYQNPTVWRGVRQVVNTLIPDCPSFRLSPFYVFRQRHPC